MTSSDAVDAAWRIPDALWERIPLLPPERPTPTGGRPRIPDRQALDAICSVLQTGCQWKALPCSLGAASTMHDRFRGGSPMKCSPKHHKYSCGIDLHVRSRYVCIVNHAGDLLVHRPLTTSPDEFLRVIAPYREDCVVVGECMFPWYWLADRCTHEGLPFVLGHALDMKAIHGGKSQNTKLDSQKIATLRRGGVLPTAYVSPQDMHAPRDLLRRRMYRRRRRSELLTPIQNTQSQYHLPAFGKKSPTKPPVLVWLPDLPIPVPKRASRLIANSWRLLLAYCPISHSTSSTPLNRIRAPLLSAAYEPRGGQNPGRGPVG